MAVVRNLMVRAGADFSAITKQAQKASQSMRGMQNSVSRSCNAMSNAAAGLKKAFMAVGAAVSVRAIVNFAKDAAEAYDKQVEGEMKLAQVMRNTMQASNDEIQSILNLTAAQQRLGVVGDEVQLAGAQQLSTYLKQSSSLETLIPVMNDLAVQQYGYNVTAEQTTSIAKLLGKAMEGQTGALTRYGFAVDDAQKHVLQFGTESERVATLAEIVTRSVGGMNSALAATPTGRMKQLANTMSDIKEQFGRAARTLGTVLLPVLNTVAKVLSAIATLANKVAQTIANVFGGTAAGKEWQYLPPSTVSAIDDAADATDNLTNSTKQAAQAAKKAKEAFQQASFDTLHILTENDSDESSSSPSSSSPDYGTGSGADDAADMIREVATASEEAGEGIGWLENLLGKIKEKIADFKEGLDLSKLSEAWDKLKKAVKSFAEAVGGVFNSVWERILKPFGQWTINEALPVILEVLAGAFDVLGAVINKLRPVFEWLWDNFLEKIAHWAGDLFISAMKEIAEQLHNIAKVINGEMSLRDFIAQLNPLEKILLAVGTAILGVKTALLAVKAVNFVKHIAELVTGFGKMTISIGESVAAAGSLNGAMTTAFGGLATTIAGIGTTIGGLTLAVTGFVDGWVNGLSVCEAATTALGLAIAAVGAVILGAPAAVAAIVAGVVFVVSQAAVAIHEHWDEITDFFERSGQALKESLAETADDIKSRWHQAGEDLKGDWQSIKDFGISCWEGIQAAAASAGESIRSGIQSAVDAVSQAVQRLAAHFEETKAKAAAAVDGMKTAWKGAGEWFKTNVSDPLTEWGRQAWEEVKTAAQTAADKVKETWSGLRSTLKTTWDNIKTAGNNAWNSIKETATAAWDAAYQGASKAWESAKSGASTAWETVKNTWGQAGNYFSSNVFQPLINAVQNGIEKVKSVFSGLSTIVESVVQKVRAAISDLQASLPSLQGVKDKISSAIGTISSKVSSVISSAKTLVTSGLANYSSLGVPALASGAVIPPNREFVAVLGDQTSGYNIETPESLLRQVVREESSNGAVLMILSDILDAVRDGKEITVDGYKLGQTVQRSLSMSARANGIA